MKQLIPVLAIALIVSACNPNDPIDPTDPTEVTDVHFSILGDSFSSFIGTVDPDTNDVWPYENVGMTSAEQMWWHKMATEMEWVMDKNNSFSGALMSNFEDFNGGAYYGPQSFIHRMDYLGTPDVIFVFGATNDIYQRAPLGDFVYESWTDDQLKTFRPALAYIFDHLKRQHPFAEIYFLLDMDLCISDVTIDPDVRQAYIQSIHRISSHYNVKCIDIYDIHKSAWHPDEQGQYDIARQVIEALKIDFNV